MDRTDAETHALLAEAAAARASGDVDAARAGFAAAYERSRDAHDIDAMTEAALGLASGQMWGALPGRAPAFLHEAYERASGESRTRLAAALARAWVYSGNPDRAATFAAEAVATAEVNGRPALLADALDAQLLVHWGPDDLAERLKITTRLEDVVAHVSDSEARLSAHLWRLTTALEVLDAVAVQRQLRALDLLAEESDTARVRFFAASRRGMYALLTGDLVTATSMRDDVRRFGIAAGEPDVFALEHTLAGGIARQAGDRGAIAVEAAVYEDFGTREGAPSVTAQAAVLWLESGDSGRAATLLHQVAGIDFAHITRDVEWLLTLVSLTQVAASVEAVDLVATAIELLHPYAGRAVVNAGAVAFEGVVDDYLAQACASIGRVDDAAGWERNATAAYRRLDAKWWLARRKTPPAGRSNEPVVHLRRAGDGTWLIGPGDRAVVVREAKGFNYLRALLGNPGIAVSALALSGTDVGEGSLGEIVDRKALDTYRRRLAELDSELDEASQWADDGRVDMLAVERDALLEQVAAATGLGGRPRKMSGSAERARVAVRKAIATAIARVGEADAATGRLLRDTIRTGSVCTYEPDPQREVQWVLD